MFRKKNGQEFMDELNADSSVNDKEEKRGFFHRKKKKEINLYEDDMGYIEDDSNFDEDEYDKELEEKKLRKAEFDAGVEQGLKQGVEQGVTLGQKQASTDTALRLLKTGKFDTKEIAELCNLPLEDVTALMK